jgi:hypothetical protein
MESSFEQESSSYHEVRESNFLPAKSKNVEMVSLKTKDALGVPF